MTSWGGKKPAERAVEDIAQHSNVGSFNARNGTAWCDCKLLVRRGKRR